MKIAGETIKLKKLIITTLFLLFILIIGTVSATNHNDNTINPNITDNPTTYTNQDDKTSHRFTYTPDQIKDKNPSKDINNQEEIIITEDSQVKTETRNVYVDKSSKSSIEDGTKANPYKTIDEKTINELKIDTILNIANGNYKLETINLNNNISIIGQNRDETILYTNSKNGLFNINANSNLKLINLTIRDYESTISPAITNNGQLTIENLFLQNASRNIQSANGGFIYSTNNLTVLNCVFDNAFASYGACIYTNNGHTIIINSSFTNNEILNVGGALYSKKSETEIYDSKFIGNKAVSGAAVYNAFGNLTVNHTYFYGNDAQHFFGGAIYNTGRTIVNNSDFIENHATIDGGAITNTNYFYSINCTYISNWANNGGAIENIPNNEEIGNLIIINNTFSENSAENQGGVIINYNDHATLAISGTIIIINTKFIENWAYQGGVIYNECILNIINSTLTDNTANEGKTVYMAKTSTAKIINSGFENDDIYCEGSDFKIELIDLNTTIIRENNPQNNNTTENTPDINTNSQTTTLNTPSKTNQKIKIYLILKNVKKVSKNVKNIYLKVIVKNNGKKLITKNITLKVKRNKVKIKTNKKVKKVKKSPVQSFKFTIKINKNLYTAKTDKKGKARYIINKLTNKRTYIAKISYQNKKYYKNAKNIKFKIK